MLKSKVNRCLALSKLSSSWRVCGTPRASHHQCWLSVLVATTSFCGRKPRVTAGAGPCAQLQYPRLPRSRRHPRMHRAVRGMATGPIAQERASGLLPLTTFGMRRFLSPRKSARPLGQHAGHAHQMPLWGAAVTWTLHLRTWASLQRSAGRSETGLTARRRRKPSVARDHPGVCTVRPGQVPLTPMGRSLLVRSAAPPSQ
mmetsp:Transcript_13952/g.32750  ORF Transcript_13952/g.32750 Transcript_13952/m.32750 type:complete len:200 (-) Transcript_13952:1216-1815(-)